MKLLTVFFALVLASTTAVAQQKIAWKGQQLVFILEQEGKITQDDEKGFKIENEKTFFAAEIVTDIDAVNSDINTVLYKTVESKEYNLVSKGDAVKTEQGAKGHYVVGEREKMLIAFCILQLPDSKFPILFSFPIEKDSPELVAKMLNAVRKM